MPLKRSRRLFFQFRFSSDFLRQIVQSILPLMSFLVVYYFYGSRLYAYLFVCFSSLSD